MFGIGALAETAVPVDAVTAGSVTDAVVISVGDVGAVTGSAIRRVSGM
jgi:hypothetical protein